MILFPNKDILTQEIQSWQGFAETLRSEDRKLFSQMLNDCYQLNEAINSKGEYFSTESLLMGLIFVQHKIINWLINNNSKDIQR
jgi:hypothetical protein